MTSRPSFNPIRFAVLRLMTLTPAPVSTRKLRDFLDCGTLTSTHRRPSRNSKGNSESETEAACTLARAAARIRTAHKRKRTLRPAQIGCQTERWTELQAHNQAF